MGLKENLLKIYNEKGKGRESLSEAGACIAEAVAKEIGVKADEVAILLVTTSGTTLKFIFPKPFFESNSAFPSDYKNSFASSVFKTMKGKVDNKISDSKHLKFYESIKGLETSGTQIQKMIGVPILYENKPIGVLEVSRKGLNPESAGPNFTAEDGQKLLTVCKEFASILYSMIPDPFF